METEFLKIFDLDMKENDRHAFENVTVTKLSKTPSREIFRVYMSSDHLIEKKTIFRAEKAILKKYFPDRPIEVRIIEKYRLSELYNAQTLFEMYRDSISLELEKHDVLLKLLFDESDFLFIPEGMNIVAPATILAEEKITALERVLDKILNERFGQKIVISYEFKEKKVDEKEEELAEKLIRNRVKNIVGASSFADHGSELVIGETAKRSEDSPESKKEPKKDTAPEKDAPPKTAAFTGKKENKKGFNDKEKKYYGSVPPDPDMIYGKVIKPDELMDISEIVGEMGEVTIRGTVFAMDQRPIKNERTIITLSVTDYTDSIVVKLFTKNDRLEELTKSLKIQGSYVITGIAMMDAFDKEIEISSVSGIKKSSFEKKKRLDEYPDKRVELHAHTKMSEMDGLADIAALVNKAKSFGHKALALTDHGVVTAFPVANHVISPDEDFKLIYGVEGYIVDDNVSMASGDPNTSFSSDFVVFDLETTGLVINKCRIIEIGAVKVRNGEIIDHFSTFVNPKVPIPFRITEITSIRDDMVISAPSVEEILPEFLKFCEGASLVGHNVRFDTGVVKENCERLGLPYDFGTVDTIDMARFLLPEQKSFQLHHVAKALKIELLHHHRAVDDAQCTALIFIKLCNMAAERGIYTFGDLNEKGKIDEEQIKKLHMYHCSILAKNDIGRVNLYRLISMSHVKYFNKRPRIPKSEIIKHREGLIIGSACSAGELFDAILLGRSDEEVYSIASFYDYLEIMPDPNNGYLIGNDKYGITSVEDLHEINRKIIKLGRELNKIVCATGDVHFVDPEDEIYRSIIKSAQGYSDGDEDCPLYFRTTEEMLREFSYLGDREARRVVIDNTNLIADMCEKISPVRPDKAPPVIENSDVELREMCYNTAVEKYGEPLPEVVKKRLDRELNSIISNGYAVMYIIAQKLVSKSMEDGYLVGSRGSVGSSFVATMSGITEVNPLSPHYYCPKCHYSDFGSEEVRAFAGRAGCDMPDKNCPNCGEPLLKDGFDIPFETFLGFKGDKEPDIDLNFSGEYQGNAHRYTEVIFGKGHTFKAGTIGTVAEKTAFGYTKSFFEKITEKTGVVKRRCEMERLALGCTEVKRTTGQHPGGIVVLPMGEEIETFTPIQKPANDMTTDIITTHFEYHSIDHNLLKLDILGHDDPTMIRRLEDLTGIKATTIKLDDKNVMRLFQSTEPLGITPDDINGIKLGTLGIPEFGTEFAMGMLIDTNPQEFTDLVRIAGLSHGTDVWLGNAKDLILSGTATISTCICTRDDIMTYLINMGVEAADAFKIMENVRKGKVAKNPKDEKWVKWKEDMKAHNVPDWYIGSCEKIKYMFPKAHAAAYVMMAWRIAWYKINYPTEYYTAFYSIRSKGFNYEMMCQGREKLRYHMEDLANRGDKLTPAEEQTAKEMKLVDEMYARGIEFMPIDIYRAEADRFIIIDGKIMPSFTAIEGMGPEAALTITKVRNVRFLSREDFKTRGKVPQGVVDYMAEMGLLDGLPMSNQISLFDLM